MFSKYGTFFITIVKKLIHIVRQLKKERCFGNQKKTIARIQKS